MASRDTRTEHDILGAVEVPAARLWGAQTERSRQHFAISSERMPLALIHALAEIKRATARVNAELGELDPDVAAAIAAAAGEVVDGRHDDEFPLAVWQSGSGTQSHMNLNEVLANRASELLGGGRGEARRVHPNDDVNRGQSSNDVMPSALALAASRALAHDLLPALDALGEVLAGKAAAFADIVKTGRTHLMDATPLTLGQAISGWVAQLAQARTQVAGALPALGQLALGGTAVGTGLNAHPELGARAAALLARESGLQLASAPNKFAVQGAQDAVVFAHGALKTLAAALNKLANDVRWLASGPRCGLGEITLPANEPGSSIMPGKVNPTQCEALAMICAQVFGNDVAINFGGAGGSFELNTYRPLLAHNFLMSARLLADGCASFARHCAAGIEPDRARIAALLERSLMLVTALAPHIGYEPAAAIAHQAHAEGISLREAALASGAVSAADFDRWVDPAAMLGPRRPD
ncbi:MAG: class II fumarate hydratase [Gammaproteobacteria bacterium]|nr:class II fumarate hydratase [Gammaproteobacteria bacterium]